MTRRHTGFLGGRKGHRLSRIRNGLVVATKRFLFFTHILKAGGTSVEAALRGALGVRHLAVDPPVGWIYSPEDFRADRRINPFAWSYSSHWLRPFIDFGPYDSRIEWHTMFREPVARFRSHRQHHVERFGNRKPFERWADSRLLRNWQTRQIAGEEDVVAARQILEEKYRFVGILERFEESLILMRDQLRLPSLPFDPASIHNPARSDRVKEQVREEVQRHADQVADANALDLELYRYVEGVLFPRQIELYGQDRMRNDLTHVRTDGRPIMSAVRSRTNLLFRRIIHIPLQRRRARVAARSGRPDARR
jgi:hypothetical protein